MATRKSYYIIRGGVQGRERLRILSRVMRPSAISLLERVGVKPGMRCLDIGCGGGDLVFDLARMVGNEGVVVGTDLDLEKLGIARAEAREQALKNVLFGCEDITSGPPRETFDIVHARFVLTHLPDPEGAVAHMKSALRPGGALVLQDIDFRGHFSCPEDPAFARYVDLYSETVRRRGGDANIGPRLARFLIDAGLVDVQIHIVQPAAMAGDVKLIVALTMESIADSVIAEGLASKSEVEALVDRLYSIADDTETLVSFPRIIQVWGYLR